MPDTFPIGLLGHGTVGSAFAETFPLCQAGTRQDIGVAFAATLVVAMVQTAVARHHAGVAGLGVGHLHSALPRTG